MRGRLLPLACLLLAARASALNGSLACLTCDSGGPHGACVAASLQLTARDLATGHSSVLARFPNASLDTLDLLATAVSPAADALFISLVAADGVSGVLVRFSLSQRAVVSVVPAPACAFLSVADVPDPASVACLTDAPYYGVDGRSYVLRIHAASGAAEELAAWPGSPVPVDVVAVVDAAAGVLYAVLADEAAGAEYVLGWSLATGKLAAKVEVPATTEWLDAVFDPRAGVLGVVNDLSAKPAATIFGALDLARGTWKTVSKALGAFDTVYGLAAAAPAAGAVFVSALDKAKVVSLVGLRVDDGAIVYNKPADGLCTSLAYLPL